MSKDLHEKTISDFGSQWLQYRDNDGFYGSVELFKDMFWPLFQPGDLSGVRAAEIGSGTGRIVAMLLRSGVASVLAIEPSEAYAVLIENVKEFGDRVECLQCEGHEIPPRGDLDYVFSVGVLHHIPNPLPVVRAAYNALKPGGKIAVWVYGREGNEMYLTFLAPLRYLTKHLPHFILAAVSWFLSWPMALYILSCKFIKLPLRNYMLAVIGPMSPNKRRLVIYDQLNPAYAKYYTRQEICDLINSAGFTDIRIHHRHGYSWSVIGTKIG